MLMGNTPGLSFCLAMNPDLKIANCKLQIAMQVAIARSFAVHWPCPSFVSCKRHFPHIPCRRIAAPTW